MRKLNFPVLRFATSGALLCGALTVSSAAFGVTYQVGPGKPYANLGAVVNLLNPGDIVEVDGNQTYPGGVVFDQPGTASQKITIRGIRINGNRPVLSGGNNTIEARANHYVFEGLDLTGGTSRCFYHHAHDITLRDSIVHDCPKQGILGADTESGSFLLEYTEVHSCGGGTFDHQIYMATNEVDYPGSVFRMQHCYVHDANGGNSVKSRAERNEIYYNWIEGALYHELELIGPDPAGGVGENVAREDSDVVGNVLRKRNTFSVTRCGGDGTGQSYGRYRFLNNTVITLQGGGAVFRLFDGIESIEMHNNVFFSIGGTVNLIRQVEADWGTGQSLIAGSNNWTITGSMNIPATWTGTIQGSSPGFADIATDDVRLDMNSVLINAGATSTAGPPGYPFPMPLNQPAWLPPLHAVEPNGTASARPMAGVIDIGAYEYDVGGTGGAGGGSTTGTGGTGGSTSGTGGSTSGTGGSTSGTGGSTTGTGGGGSTTGTGGSTSGTGGSTSGTGGSTSGTGGSTSGTGGSTSGTGGSTTGTGGGGSTTGTGGGGGSTTAGSGGMGAAGGLGGGGTGAGDPAEESSCGCRTTPAAPGAFTWMLVLGSLGAALRRRARRARAIH